MIILIGGEKGGTGKTTLATNLAAQRSAAGHTVLLIDADPQGSASNWTQLREEAGILPKVTCVQKFGQALVAEIQQLAHLYEDVIIDVGGRGDSLELSTSLATADKAIIPLQASQFDLWTLARMDKLVATARQVNPSLQALVIIGRASPHPLVAEASEALSVLADYPQLQRLATVIRDRIAYRRSSHEGKAVSEIAPADKKAIKEVQDLYDELTLRGVLQGHQLTQG
jgi:chromosome partitioning protein